MKEDQVKSSHFSSKLIDQNPDKTQYESLQHILQAIQEIQRRDVTCLKFWEFTNEEVV